MVAPFSEKEYSALTSGGSSSAGTVYVTVTPSRKRPYIVVDDNTPLILYPWARQALMTHEMVHAASTPTASEAPPAWLEEGFASFVVAHWKRFYTAKAWRVAGPKNHRLPTSADFRKTPDRAYFQAWSLCTYIAQTWGRPKLIALHRDQLHRGGDHLDASLHDILGVSRGRLVAGWLGWFHARAAQAG